MDGKGCGFFEQVVVLCVQNTYNKLINTKTKIIGIRLLSFPLEHVTGTDGPVIGSYGPNCYGLQNSRC